MTTASHTRCTVLPRLQTTKYKPLATLSPALLLPSQVALDAPRGTSWSKTIATNSPETL